MRGVGLGIHRCIGSMLARKEMRVAPDQRWPFWRHRKSYRILQGAAQLSLL
jgi:hypothetical protein